MHIPDEYVKKHKKQEYEKGERGGFVPRKP